MSFESLWAKVAQFKKTGELDKVIMAKLAAVLPVKQLFYKFLQDAADGLPEFESDDAFLNWLNDLTRQFVERDKESIYTGTEAKLDPDKRGTARIFVPGQKMTMSMLEADRAYLKPMKGLVAMIRAAPRPPISDSEAERIEAQYKVKVV